MRFPFDGLYEEHEVALKSLDRYPRQISFAWPQFSYTTLFISFDRSPQCYPINKGVLCIALCRVMDFSILYVIFTKTERCSKVYCKHRKEGQSPVRTLGPLSILINRVLVPALPMSTLVFETNYEDFGYIVKTNRYCWQTPYVWGDLYYEPYLIMGNCIIP